MLRTALVALISGVVGYAVGTLFGFRTAVVDYVENNGRQLDKLAESMYDDASSAKNLDDEEMLRQMREGYANKSSDDEDESDDGGASAFQ